MALSLGGRQRSFHLGQKGGDLAKTLFPLVDLMLGGRLHRSGMPGISVSWCFVWSPRVSDGAGEMRLMKRYI